MDLRPANNSVVRINAGLDQTTGLVTWRFISLDPATMLPTQDPLAGFLPPNKNPPEGDGSVLFSVAPKAGLATGTEIRNKARIIFDTNAPIDTPEWLNTIDVSKPSSQVAPLAATQTSSSFEVSWSGTDQGAGIADYTIYVSEDGGPFTLWQANTTALKATFTGIIGKSYGFYSVARDRVNNREDASASPDATTRVVAADAIPPVTTATVSPTPGPASDGWINTDAVVTLTATDNDGGSGVEAIYYAIDNANCAPGALSSCTVSSAPVTVSAEGVHTLYFFGKDKAGNFETRQTRTIKIDKTPPTMSCSVTPNVLWPPNQKLEPITTTVNVADVLSGANGFTLTGVTSSEPSAPGAEVDIQGFEIGTADTTGQLRSERLGSSSGRVYTLTYRGSDKAGNTTTCSPTVTVPHDRAPGVGVEPGSTGLVTTLTARAGCGSIARIQFVEPGRRFDNAQVTVTTPSGGPSNQTSGFTYTPPAGTTSVVLTIQRVSQASGASVNPVLFYDGCGEWRTFVGGGPNAFR